MRKLFFALLVLNLVLWLWGKRQELALGQVPAEPGVGVIRLLDESEVAARRESSVTPAVPAVAGPVAQTAPSPLPGASPEPEPEPEPVAAATETTAGAVIEEVSREPDIASADGTPASSEAVDTAQAITSVAEASSAGSATPTPELPGEVAASPARAAPSDEAPTAGAEAVEQGQAASPDTDIPASTDSPQVLTDVGVASEAATPGEVTAAAAMAEEAPDVEAASRTPAGAPVPAPELEMGAEERPATALPAGIVCASAGTFRDRAAAEKYAAGLRPPVAGATVREESIAKATRFWVLAPAASDADPAYRQSLVDAGIRDAWRVKVGPLAGRLSLGAFQSQDNARRLAAVLAARGIGSEVQGAKEQERRWWVDFERPDGTPPPAAAGQGGQESRQIIDRRCGRVAGP